MLKKILFLFLLIFLLPPQKTFAVTTTINNYPSSISSEPFTIEVSISGAGAGTNYLRADLYKEGSTNYFGETYNGSSWYGGSDSSQYFSITIESGATASATIQARVGEPTASEYNGAGNYKLRIRRYTSSGGYSSSEANNASVSLNINVATPTPTPTSTPTPSPTPVPSATKTPVPSKPSAPKPTPTPVATSISVSLATDEEVSESSVLSESSPSSELEVLKDPTSEPIETKVASENNLQPIFIGAGIILLTGSGYLVFRSLKKNE